MMIKTNFEQLYLEKHESSTLFLPSNEAVTRMKPSSLDNLKKKDALIEFLLNHVALGKYHTREFRPNMVLESRTNHSILINKRNNRKVCTYKLWCKKWGASLPFARAAIMPTLLAQSQSALFDSCMGESSPKCGACAGENCESNAKTIDCVCGSSESGSTNRAFTKVWHNLHAIL